MRHTVIVSDVHLWQGAPDDGLWMRYRHRRYFPDTRLARLFGRVCEYVEAGAAEFVLNGDIFDFDVPPVEGGRVVERRSPHDEDSARERMSAILDDHETFVCAIADVLAHGHRVVFVAGNHDVQLCFESVRCELSDRILAAVQSRHPHISRVDASERIVFRSWFHRTADGIHVEHGNQYDRYCSVRYPTEPFTADGRRVQPTMGSLVMQHLVSRMGYFNPNVDSSFLLTTRAYIQHWLRFYFLSRRSLAFAWAIGSLRIALSLILGGERSDGSRAARLVATAERETGADARAIRSHAENFVLTSLRHAVILLRLDRLAVVVLLLTACAIASRSLLVAVPFLAGAIAVLVATSTRSSDRDLGSVYESLPPRALAIAKLHGARAIVFGHTHIAQERWIDGVFVGNCGTWAAAYHDVECEQPVEDAGPFVWLWTDGNELGGGLMSWNDGIVDAHRVPPPIEPDTAADEAEWAPSAPAQALPR